MESYRSFRGPAMKVGPSAHSPDQGAIRSGVADSPYFPRLRVGVGELRGRQFGQSKSDPRPDVITPVGRDRMRCAATRTPTIALPAREISRRDSVSGWVSVFGRLVGLVVGRQLMGNGWNVSISPQNGRVVNGSG